MKYDFKYIIIIIFVFSAFMAQGQEFIKLEKAMEIARVNNSKLRSDALLIKYQHALVNTAYNFAPVQINAELGQFNSSYFDSGFGVSQTFNLPQVYRRRADANRQQAKTTEYLLTLSESEIKQQVDQVFME